MEGNTNGLDNTNLLSAIERLSTQVQQLQTTVNSQQTSSRRTVTPEENEGSGDEGGSESRKENKGRHGIRADTFKIFKFDGTKFSPVGVCDEAILESSTSVGLCLWKSDEA